MFLPCLVAGGGAALPASKRSLGMSGQMGIVRRGDVALPSACGHGFNEPAGDPLRISTDDALQIDHVLARDATITDCRVVRESGDLSDHYPIVARVTTG